MRARVRMMILALAALSPVAACDSDPVGATPDGSSFVASVAGDFEATYEGRGYFHALNPPRGVPRPAMFTLHSADPDRINRQVQSFTLHRLGTELPAVGSYAIGRMGLQEGDPQLFQASYDRAVGGTVERYTGIVGEVQITASSAEGIEGTFRFTGVRTCTGTMSHMQCTFYAGPDGSKADPADRATIEVAGSFVAIPGRPRGLPLR